MRRVCAALCLFAVSGLADDNRSLADRTRQYLTDLVRLNTSNPSGNTSTPSGNETKVANYLKQVADSYGINAELLGSDPQRLNFVARLKGTGKGRPLLLLAHSDVYPSGDAKTWSADPFGAENRGGYIYGRGTLDAKSLLAADLAVMVEIRRRNIKLSRDLILVAEAGEETGGAGIQWLIQNQWAKVDAEFALNEGGVVQDSKDGVRLFQVQTLEKVSTPIILSARGPSARGAVPRPDNPVLHLSQAVVKLSEADQDQPVHLNATTRRYLQTLAAKLSDDSWLAPLLPNLDIPAKAQAAAAQIRMRDLDLYAMLHTTVDPTDTRRNARASLDVRRMPSETREEVLARLRQIVNDSSIELAFAPGQPVPATEASSTTTALYRAMEKAIARVYPHDAVVVPFMGRGSTDSAYLRSRGMAVYGVPVFVREAGETRIHAIDERISTKTLDDGVELLWQMVQETTGEN